MQTNPQRLLSLDFFRGLTVAAMILVNNPGNWSHIYAPLEHAEWHGCTPTDLVFPFFLFIVGVSLVYATGSKRESVADHPQLIKKIIKRGLTLIGLGIFLNIYPMIFYAPIEALQTARIPGVLQRIGLVYMFAGIIFLKQSDKGILKTVILLLIAYWALMTFVPVPGIGYANLEKATNLGAWLDRTLLTEAHLWKLSKTWDPEGLLTTMPAIGTSLLGVLAGIYLKNKTITDTLNVARLIYAGILAIIMGLLWNFQFPINKSLWTSAYVLYSGGIAVIIFAICYWIIDVKQYRWFTKPFVIYGVNAITVFFLSSFIPRTLNLIKVQQPDGTEITLLTHFYKQFFEPYFSPLNASLTYALFVVLFFYVLLWVMYKKNIIIKV